MQTLEPNTPEWVEARRGGIGGSDAAQILGISPFGTPWTLYMEKVGRYTGSADNESTFWGHMLEPVIREVYAKRTGRVVQPGAVLQASAERPFMFANTDAQIAAPAPGWKDLPSHRTPGVGEIKTTDARFRGEWIKGVPLFYQVQVQHYMYCQELEWCGVGCLAGGNRLFLYDVERNDRFLKAYVRRADEFWARVQNEDPPPMEGHPATEAVLDELYPDRHPVAVEVDAELHGKVTELLSVRSQLGDLSKAKDRLVLEIRAAMGSHEFGWMSDGRWLKNGIEGTANRKTIRVLKRKPKNVKVP